MILRIQEPEQSPQRIQHDLIRHTMRYIWRLREPLGLNLDGAIHILHHGRIVRVVDGAQGHVAVSVHVVAHVYPCRGDGLADQVWGDGEAGAVVYVKDGGGIGDGDAVDFDFAGGKRAGGLRSGAEAAG